MKWNEMTTIRKVVCVVGWICGISYLILSFFDLIILSFFDLTNLPTIPKAALCPLFGIYWLCMGINLKSRKLAIMYYILAAAWFLLSLLHLLF